jgi:hypothetical protein
MKDGRGSSPSVATVLSRVGKDPLATEELADVAPPHAILLQGWSWDFGGLGRD